MLNKFYESLISKIKYIKNLVNYKTCQIKILNLIFLFLNFYLIYHIITNSKIYNK